MSKENRAERKERVIAVLNEARSMELQAIHQYMNQHYNLDDMDYGELAAQLKLIALDEIRHSEMIAERIKELGGEPTAEPCGAIKKGQAVEVIFGADAEEEDGAIDAYNQFLKVCLENGDSISARLLETIIDQEQMHYNYFDSVDGHIKELGPTYLAKVAGTPASTGLQPQGFAVRQEGGA